MTRPTLNSLEMLPVWVSPEHLVATARIVLRGHGLSSLPVATGAKLLGFVSVESLAGAGERDRLAEHVKPFPVVLEAETPIAEAAATFARNRLDLAPVVDADRFLGVVWAHQLLGAIAGEASGELAGEAMPSLEALRRWGARNFAEGNELTVLCLDLDGFGAFNRRHGYPAGDLALRTFGEALRAACEPERDAVCRFGGDEFLVATRRGHAEALGWADAFRASLRAAPTDLPEPLDFTLGAAGGKRGKERLHAHPEAMIENLVRLAQADCEARKSAPSQAAGAPPQRIEVLAVQRVARPEPMVQVILGVGEATVGGIDASTGSAEASVAAAAARALESAHPGLRVAFDSIQRFDDPAGTRLIGAAGRIIEGDASTPIAGTARAGDDPDRAVAEAAVDAFLRKRRSAEAFDRSNS